jgi:hypothetical protein
MKNVYFANLALRIMIFLPCLFFAAGGLLVLGAMLANGGVEMLLPGVFPLLWAAFWGFNAYNAFSHNRMEVGQDRVKMPTTFFFPANLFGGGEVKSFQVVRWGIGQAPTFGIGGMIARLLVGPDIMLVEVKDAHGSVRTWHIQLGSYATEDARAITEFFEMNCRRQEEVVLDFFWGLQFAS